MSPSRLDTGEGSQSGTPPVGVVAPLTTALPQAAPAEQSLISPQYLGEPHRSSSLSTVGVTAAPPALPTTDMDRALALLVANPATLAAVMQALSILPQQSFPPPLVAQTQSIEDPVLENATSPQQSAQSSQQPIGGGSVTTETRAPSVSDTAHHESISKSTRQVAPSSVEVQMLMSGASDVTTLSTPHATAQAVKRHHVQNPLLP